ncbi:MAG: extracellular solute-binding protein, partial [Alicyclobacillus sp.]|nr:extracellular solute-binding protein [Alicyclobacillus sp.]
MFHWRGLAGTALSAVLAAGLVAGCGGAANNAAPGNAPANTGAAGGAKPFAGKTLNIVLANHPWADAIQKLLPDFEQQTGMKVQVTSYFETQLSDKLSVSFTAGSTTPDVFMYRPLQEGKQFFKNGWIQPLNNYVNQDTSWNWNDFTNVSRGTVTFNGQVTGVPIVTEEEVLYYRKDLFQKAGLQPPKTIDELVADAKKLNDPQHGVYGFVARGKRADAVTQESSFLYSYGGDWTKDGKAAVNTPEAIQAFTTYGTLLKDYGPPGVLNMSWPQAAAIFAQGKAAMFTDASSIYQNVADPSKSTVANQVGYAAFPAGPAGSKPYSVTSWGLAINAKSQLKDAAWAFTQWALRERARAKFPDADRMLFTREALEQATPYAVARYHASRFPAGVLVADLTAGIGGDLMALAERGPVVAFEPDEERAACAEWNAGIAVRREDAMKAEWDWEYAFCDPSRRRAGRRLTQPQDFSPNPVEVARRMADLRLGGIKLSPMLSDT